MPTGKPRIRKAKTTDLERVVSLYRACTRKMNREGLDNWNPAYPGKSTFLQDIRQESLFIMESGEPLMAAVTLNREEPPEYNGLSWEVTGTNILVVHRLAVNPQFRGKGYAKQFMAWAEQLASRQHAESIHMDVYTVNTPARKLYEKLGYRELETFRFPGFEVPYVGLEKVLAPTG